MSSAARLAAALVLGALCFASGASRGAETDETAEPSEPVVREVVRMLEAGVGEDVVVRWLERERRSPGRLAPDDLIALTRAGASPGLIERLMASPQPEATEPPPRAPAPAAAPAEAAADGPRFELAIRYRPYRDPEASDEDAWRLFAYVDGEPQAWSDGRNWLSKARRTVEVALELTPGRHVVRLVEERHVERGRGFRHEARVCPDAIEFDSGQARRRLEIELSEPTGLDFRRKRGFRFGWSEAAREPEWSPLAEPFSSWPPLCEEIEANTRPDRRPSRADRRALEHCVRWGELWPDVAGLPDRATVRAELERAGFRPPLADR